MVDKESTIFYRNKYIIIIYDIAVPTFCSSSDCAIIAA